VKTNKFLIFSYRKHANAGPQSGYKHRCPIKGRTNANNHHSTNLAGLFHHTLIQLKKGKLEDTYQSAGR